MKVAVTQAMPVCIVEEQRSRCPPAAINGGISYPAAYSDREPVLMSSRILELGKTT
jgi:hypothetical protein